MSKLVTSKTQHYLMFEMEENFFWFTAIREYQKYFINKYFEDKVKNEICILDAGCATGYFIIDMKREGYQVQGFDYSDTAIELGQKRGLELNKDIFKMDIFNLQFEQETFDCIILNDVLFAFDLKEANIAINNLKSLLKPNGIFIGQTASFQWLYSQNDIVARTKYRYTKKEISDLLLSNNFDILKLSYRNFILFIPLVIKRFTTGNKNKNNAKSELTKNNNIINSIIKIIFSIENFLLRYINCFIGGTIFWIGKKMILNKELFKNKVEYKVENNKYIFNKLEFSDIEDGLDKVKNFFKKNPKFYYFLINLISPILENKKVNKFLDENINDDIVALNIGRGNSKISDNVFNVDIFAYDNVDVVCDIENLPFKDNSIDVILNLVVLEHVPNPQRVVSEIYRVLKPNGIIYSAIPFIQGFHASPYDFTRFTEEGIKILHKDFEQLDLKIFGGPTSALLNILQEYIAILFSFGNKKLHILIYLTTMLLTFPFKFLDYFLIKHPMAKNIASGFIYMGKKIK